MRRRRAGLVAEDDAALDRPALEDLAQAPGLPHRRQIEAFGLLRRLHDMGGEALEIDPGHGGVLGEDRLQAPAAELRRLLGQEIDALALQRGEHEPEIRTPTLGDGLALDGEPRAVLGEFLDLGQPFAVAAVEEQGRGALLPPQHIAQVMAARRIQRDRRTGRQRRIHIEARNHPVGFRPSIHPRFDQSRFNRPRFNWLSIARRS